MHHPSSFIKILLCLSSFFLAGTARADQPFRTHRYDALNALPVHGDNIVFIGNSITNMHEWWEAFGNPLVLNRGVSGAVSDEMLDNLSPILQGQPQKAFIMIGTNDLGTPGIDNAAHVAANLRTALQRFRRESPRTQVFVQSILPSRRRNIALQRETNDSLRCICRDMNVQYVDLWDDLYAVTEDNQFTLDGLHLSAAGYRIWCQRIAPLVGTACTYPALKPNNSCGLTYSNGMRATQFGMLKVDDGDILLIGDEMVHGGEWHELLGSPRVKSRSIGWGYPGVGIGQIHQCLSEIFKGRPDNGTPAAAVFYVGTANIWGSDSLHAIAAAYRSMIEDAHRLSPTTCIVVASLLPTPDAATNTTRIAPLNAMLQAMTKELKYAEFIDFHAALQADGGVRPDCFLGYYISGKGYARLAELLKNRVM